MYYLVKKCSSFGVILKEILLFKKYQNFCVASNELVNSLLTFEV